MSTLAATEKPRQPPKALWNISFGFFGIQIGFALQNANMSRIFQSLGSSLDDLPALWIAAPLTGLLVQPVIGYLSDRTWLGRFGRRRPYFVAGALLAGLSLFLMPLSQLLLMSALLLWMLDASLNISMEPFRAFVGDMLRKDQLTAGYAAQTAFIGAGAVVGSAFPWLLDGLGVSNVATGHGIPDTVKYSFWFGGLALVAAVLWTVFTTKEYSPDEMARFSGGAEESVSNSLTALQSRSFVASTLWIIAGALVLVAVRLWGLEKELYLLATLLMLYGFATAAAIALARRGKSSNMLSQIVGDFAGMPSVMKRLALVQFFSWSALFIMWIYTTPVVAANAFGASDPASARYQEAANWVGILFATYNGIAAVAALTVLPLLAARIGKPTTHMLCLVAGCGGFLGLLLLRDAEALLLAEIGIGIAWASILAMPYAILAASLPQAKLGVYMGLFNIFIVIPQLLVATAMGSLMKAWFPDQPVWTMLVGALVLAAAAIAMVPIIRMGSADAGDRQ